MPLHLHHVAIICSDYQRSKRFYVDILGLRILAETFRPDRNSYKLDLATDPRDTIPPRDAPAHDAAPIFPRIELFSFPNPPPRPTHPEARGLRHLAFAVTDLTAELARLASLGVIAEPVRTDTTPTGRGKRFTFIKDPDDLPIELYEA
jgi:glyoxylase I family protein